MNSSQFPTQIHAEPEKENQVILVASGDLRLAANQECWPAQEQWKLCFPGLFHTWAGKWCVAIHMIQLKDMALSPASVWVWMCSSIFLLMRRWW